MSLPIQKKLIGLVGFSVVAFTVEAIGWKDHKLASRSRLELDCHLLQQFPFSVAEGKVERYFLEVGMNPVVLESLVNVH